MKYTLSKEKSEVTLKFKATEEEWNAAETKAYQETKGKYKVPGFRQGHAPKHMIESVYGAGVFADDAMDVLIEEGYEQFTEEKKDIVPLDRPSAAIDKFDGKNLEFSLTFPVTPEVKIGEYKGIKIPKAEYNANDGQVEEELKRALERSARVEEKETGAENGDIVNLDYSGIVDGVKFAGGTAEKFNLTLGSDTFIPGFEEQLIGVKKGDEKDVCVKFPEVYHSDELKGKDAVFSCKINSVSVKIVPVMDDAWAQDVSEFSTLAEYRQSVSDNLRKQGEERVRKDNENNVINAIVDVSEADIPEVLVETYLDDMLRDMEMRLYYQGMKLEDFFKYSGTTAEEFRQEHHDDARRGTLTRLVLEELIKREHVTATDEEAARKYAENAPASADGAAHEPDKRELDYIKNEIILDRLLDLLLENALIEEKSDEKAPAAKKPAAKKTAAKKTAKSEE